VPFSLVPFSLVPFGLMPFGIVPFWQTVKLLNSQNYFLFKGCQLIAWLGQKTKLKLFWTFFSSFNFQFFFFLS